MTRLIASALLLLSLAPAHAEEAKSSVLSWFKNWKNSLERSAVEGRYRRMRTSTAVAAVRGAGQAAQDPLKPYWKGGWSDKRAAERAKEREELAAAVGLILAEKPAEARAALDAFEKAHPESSYLGDVAEARKQLAALEAAAAPPAATVETKAEETPAEVKADAGMNPASAASGRRQEAAETPPTQPATP